jgi:hypothetical protein
MKEVIIQLVILLAGFVAGFNWKKNKKMQTDVCATAWSLCDLTKDYPCNNKCPGYERH